MRDFELNAKYMVNKLLSHYGTYRETSEYTGIAKSTLNDIVSGKTCEDNMLLSTYRLILGEYLLIDDGK